MMGNLQMGDKKITDLETQDDINIFDYPNYLKDSKMAINKEYARENFLKKDGVDYDLRQSIIKNCEPYHDGLFNYNDLVSKAFVDAEIAKLPKDVLKLDGSHGMTGNLQMGDHTITGIRSSSQDNAALTVGSAKSIFLPLFGNKGMEGTLNMSNNSIRYLKMPPSDPSRGNPPDDCVINFKYFHDHALNRKNPQRMEAKLDMHLYDIINLPTAASNESSYAANVNYVNTTVGDNNATIRWVHTILVSRP